jgi:hypothetical protein
MAKKTEKEHEKEVRGRSQLKNIFRNVLIAGEEEKKARKRAKRGRKKSK